MMPNLGGWSFAENPDFTSEHAAVCWTVASQPAAPIIEAASGGSDDLWLDIRQLNVPVDIIVDTAKVEHASIHLGQIQLNLHIVSGTLLAGPVMPILRLPVYSAAAQQIRSFSKFLRVYMSGKLPHSILSRRNLRIVNALRVADARWKGATHRDVANLLFGEARVAAEWNSQSDFLHSRVRRLIKLSEHLASGGWRALLKP